MSANHYTTYRFIVLALCLVFSVHGMADRLLTLDSCLSLAQQHNKKIQQAALNVSKAEEVKKQAMTKYFPQVSASAVGYHSLHPMVEIGIDDISNASVRDLLTTLYGNYGAALGLDNTLSLFHYGYQVGVTAVQPVYMGGSESLSSGATCVRLTSFTISCNCCTSTPFPETNIVS